jgi:LppX_LprAFG lipoprotein
MAFFDPAQGALAVIRGAAGATMSGSEDVGGVPSYRIAATVRADALTPLLGNPATSARLPVELWIGKRDKPLRRISLAGATTAKESATAVRTVELSAFGSPFTSSSRRHHIPRPNRVSVLIASSESSRLWISWASSRMASSSPMFHQINAPIDARVPVVDRSGSSL